MQVTTPAIGLLFWTMCLLVYLAMVVLALISIMRHEFKGGNSEKWMWLVLIICLPVIGSIVYYFTRSERQIS